MIIFTDDAKVQVAPPTQIRSMTFRCGDVVRVVPSAASLDMTRYRAIVTALLTVIVTNLPIRTDDTG